MVNTGTGSEWRRPQETWYGWFAAEFDAKAPILQVQSSLGFGDWERRVGHQPTPVVYGWSARQSSRKVWAFWAPTSIPRKFHTFELKSRSNTGEDLRRVPALSAPTVLSITQHFSTRTAALSNAGLHNPMHLITLPRAQQFIWFHPFDQSPRY